MYQISVNLKNFTFWDQICQKKNMNEKNFEKINVQVKISIYNVSLDKFHLIQQTSDFVGPNFPKENINDKNFEKINIKIEISTQQSTYIPNFSQSEELQILRPNLRQKYEWKEF